jgi:hypothetical protein
MSRFYHVQIDSIYITSDGTNGGDPCKLSVAGASELLQTVTGAAIPTIGGTVFQLVPYTKGKRFSVAIDQIMKDQWDDLVTLINNTLETDGDFTVSGTGDIGDFSATVKPFPVSPFKAQSFINGRIRGVTLEFITV